MVDIERSLHVSTFEDQPIDPLRHGNELRFTSYYERLVSKKYIYIYKYKKEREKKEEERREME